MNSQTGRQLKRAHPRNICTESIEVQAPSAPILLKIFTTVSYATAGTSAENHSLAVLQELIVATGVVTLTTNSLPFLQQSTYQSCRAGQNDHLVSTPSQALLQWLLVILLVLSSFMTPGTTSWPPQMPVKFLSATPTLRLLSMLPSSV